MIELPLDGRGGSVGTALPSAALIVMRSPPATGSLNRSTMEGGLNERRWPGWGLEPTRKACAEATSGATRMSATLAITMEPVRQLRNLFISCPGIVAATAESPILRRVVLTPNV